MIFDALANNIFPTQQPGVGYIKNFVTVKSYIFLTGSFNSYTGRLYAEGFCLQPPAKRLKAILWRFK